jgi:hypothetical protein
VLIFKSQTDFSRFSRGVWTVSGRFSRVLDESLTFPKRIDEFGTISVQYAAPDCLTNQFAILWEDGGPMVDLNTLVPPNSGLHLFEAQQINDRGEIAVQGTDANSNKHAVLLIPCDEHHPGVKGCDHSMVDAATAAQSAVPRSVPSGTQRLPQSRRSNRYHIPGYNQLAR